MRRAVLPPLVACTALALASCGGSDASSQAARPLPPVRVKVTAPSDSLTTRSTSITVRGSVEPPGATVRVLGQPAEVVGAAFTAQVDLQPGANVIDVAATAARRGPALTAIRVTREMPIAVPDLSGLTSDEARGKLQALGLRYDETKGGGLFEGILPGDPAVCEQDPSPGADAMRGATVRVIVSKSC